MSERFTLLAQVRVASPCDADWNSMRGDDRVRHCTLCDLNVYNISAMTSEEAEELLASREGRLCVRYFRRHDGTVIPGDCPVGLAAVRKRIHRYVGIAVLALVSGISWAAAVAQPPERRGDMVRAIRDVEPIRSVCDYFDPPAVAGAMPMPH